MHLMIGLTVNATGSDRFEPLIIGHARKSWAFNNKTGEELGFFYLNNSKAWMTSVFFEAYLCRFNHHVNHKVLLLIDNVPSHAFEHLKQEFSNIELLPLPPNTTSKLQPLDAGIIIALKRHYQKCQLSHALNCIEIGKHPYKIDQLTAMKWIKCAWQDLDTSIFINCWKHITLLNFSNPSATSIFTTSTSIDNQSVDDELTKLIHILTPSQSRMNAQDFLNPIEELLTDVILNDEELLEAAQSIKVDIDSEEEDSDMMPLHELFSKEEQIKAFSLVLSVMESSEDLDNEETRKILQRLKYA